MILDSKRRRTLPRRALIFGVAAAAAMLVPLAMLKPTAEAQTVPAVTDIVQIVGVADASAPAAGEWDQAGNPLPTGTFPYPLRDGNVKISTPTGKKALFVAFRITTTFRQNSSIIVNSPAAQLGGVTMTTFKNGDVNSTVTASSLQTQSFDGTLIYMAGFSASSENADFQVGVASEAGKETVDCLKTVGKVHLQTPSGQVIFTLVPNPHHLPPAQATHSNAVFMVSDHFHSPSPLKADNGVQIALHDGMNDERAIYALDSGGRVIAKLAGGYTPSLDAGERFKMEQLVSIPKPLLKRIASFRLVARPYQWTEFKNVALQPSK